MHQDEDHKTLEFFILVDHTMKSRVLPTINDVIEEVNLWTKDGFYKADDIRNLHSARHNRQMNIWYVEPRPYDRKDDKVVVFAMIRRHVIML